MKLDVTAEVILSQLGYSNNEASLKQAQKAIDVTKGYEKFAKQIITLNDHLKKMNAYVGLSNKTDFFKIKLFFSKKFSMNMQFPFPPGRWTLQAIDPLLVMQSCPFKVNASPGNAKLGLIFTL